VFPASSGFAGRVDAGLTFDGSSWFVAAGLPGSEGRLLKNVAALPGVNPTIVGVAHNRGNGNADRAEPSAADLRRWRQHLANERAEAGVYRDLAQRRTGAERDILLALAAAEGRHEQHWLALLKGDVGKPRRSDIRSQILGFSGPPLRIGLRAGASSACRGTVDL
jgi:hypothetical protein